MKKETKPFDVGKHKKRKSRFYSKGRVFHGGGFLSHGFIVWETLSTGEEKKLSLL